MALPQFAAMAHTVRKTIKKTHPGSQMKPGMCVRVHWIYFLSLNQAFKLDMFAKLEVKIRLLLQECHL